LRSKRRGIWQTKAWAELAAEAAVLASALSARGLQYGDHIAALGDSSPQLLMVLHAAHYLGAIVIPLSPEACTEDFIPLIQNLGVRHAFAQDQEQVDKLLSVLPRCPDIACIVFDNDRGMRNYVQPQLVSYMALLNTGQDVSKAATGAVAYQGDATAFVFHRVGQTEKVSHADLLKRAQAVIAAEVIESNDVAVACLAPALQEQILFSYIQPLLTGHCVSFPESSETLLSDMREMGPSILLAPVGALKALYASAKERSDDAGALKRLLYQSYMQPNASLLGKFLVQGPMRDVLGLSRLSRVHVLGEPDADTRNFFEALGIALKVVPDVQALTSGSGDTAAPVGGYLGAPPSRSFPIGGAILELSGISLRFGGVKALTNISFNVREHEVLAIIGPNGAGKSSMLNVINGVYLPQEGSLTFRGERIAAMTPTRAAHLGISRTFQNIALFKGMSVLDNIMAGRTLKMRANFVEVALQLPRARREESEHRAKVEEIIEFLEIEDIRKTPVARLPYGLQKRVELGRALAAEPEILLLDEPMAGMNIEEKQDMSRFILDVNDHYGTTLVLIEHDMGVVMDISDRVVVLDYGKKIGDGTPDEVRANPEVIDAYLGVAH
jgi:branched-chain amino acid transport system ATP-binding protein